MINRTHLKAQNGSALAWAIVWLGGITTIAWGGATYAIPRLEQKLQENVEQSIATLDSSPVNVDVKGTRVTLSGVVSSVEVRNALLLATGKSPGVRSVWDQLAIAEVPQFDIGTLKAINNLDEVAALILPPEYAGDDSESVDSPDDGLPEEEPESSFITARSAADNGLPAPRPEPPAAITPARPQADVMPSMTLRIAGNILAVHGIMSADDDTATLLRHALDAFELDVVSNAIESSPAVMRAEWLDSILRVAPLMKNIDNPKIEVLERQITISGTAPNRSVHDAIISEALTSLGEFSLVERIRIDEEAGSKAQTSTPAVDVPVPPDVPAPPDVPVPPDVPAAPDVPVAGVTTLQQALSALPGKRILFESQSNVLTPDSLLVLDKIASIIVQYPDTTLTIEGHTDSTGSNEENLQLSLLRATTVRDHLIDRGVSVYRLRAMGFGEEVPIADNRTAQGRATNRRIDFTF